MITTTTREIVAYILVASAVLLLAYMAFTLGEINQKSKPVVYQTVPQALIDQTIQNTQNINGIVNFINQATKK